MKKQSILKVLCFAIVLFGGAFSSSAKAATIVVTRGDDRWAICNSGVDCSLREAMQKANNGDVIGFTSYFDSPRTITLTQGSSLRLQEGATVTINGRGANMLTIDGSNSTIYQMFQISHGSVLNLNGVTLTNANSGAFYVAASATVNLNQVVINNCRYDVGGAILLYAATVNINNSTINNNSSSRDGSAIFAQQFSTVNITNSTISGNTSPNPRGAAISIDIGTTVNIVNSTITKNTANGGNSAGGIYNTDFSTKVNIKSSIVAENPSVNSTNIFGSITSQSYNILSGNPYLLPLADNVAPGGGTLHLPTHALDVCSPAINAGDPNTTQTTDERGAAGVHKGRDAIGAYESNFAACPAAVTVTNNNDSGAGSLRQAVNDIVQGGTISFPSGGADITLTSGEISINKDVNIGGGGANQVTVRGNNQSRIFTVSGGRTLNLSKIVLADGNAGGAGGGAIVNYGTLNVTGSAIVNSKAQDHGGGIYNNGTLSLTNSTVSGNQSHGKGAGIYNNGYGGGSANATLLNSTVTDNRGFGYTGAGVWNDNGTFSARNTIIDGNFSDQGYAHDYVGGLYNQGYNLIGTRNPGLAPLGNYGGATLTHALLCGSPAIDAADPNNANNPATDQRGAARPVNGRADIGAVEAGICINIVTNGGNSGAGSLRQAILDANTGGTITFASNVTGVTLTGGELLINKNLTISGNTTPPTISGNNQSRVFNVAVGATLNLNRVTITGGNNSGGGAVCNYGTLNAANSTFSGNNDGGIGNYGGTMTILNSTVSGNNGGIVNSGMLSLLNSTFSGNQTSGKGAGIYNNGGGGILATVLNSTITNNRGFGYTGAGVWNDNAGNTFVVRNSIIDGNFSDQGYAHDYVGGLINQGNNLIGTRNPGLAPLGNYGGTTQTHALLQNSAALDAGNNCVLTANGCGDGNAALSTDQRGSQRKIGANVDIGAFERNITFDQTTLPNGNRTQPYSQTLTAMRAENFAADLLRSEKFDLFNADSLLASFTFSIVTISGQSLPPGLTLASDGTISGTPTAAGTYTFTVKAIDSDGMAGVGQYAIFIGNPPTISDIPNQNVNQNVSTGAIAFTVGDVETAAANLSLSGSSSNTTLVPNGSITFGGSGANRTITVNPATGQIGTATITVTVTDADGGTASDTFVLTVTNTPPTISDIPNQTVSQNASTGAIAFTVGDAETPAGSLTVAATSSNAALVPNNPANLTLGGSGANRTLTITPAANQNGTATITVTVTDANGDTAGDTFVLTVTNTPPTISDIADQSTNEDTATNAIAFTIGDAETPASNLVVAATSSNQTLIPNANITLGGADANRTIRLVPALDQFGTATITVTVSDGYLTAQDTFVLTVNPVNDAPSFTKGADQTIDEDAGAQTVSGWATNISAGPNETGQTLTFNVSITGTTGGLTFSSQPAINAATGTLTYTPAPDSNGTATVSVTLSDNGSNTPPNRNTSAAQTFTITVNPVNDAPTLDVIANPAAILEDASQQTVNLTGISAGGGESQTLTVTAASDNTALIPNPIVNYTSPNATGSLSYTPVANANGSAVITVTVTDSSGAPNNSISRTFTVNVTAVNDNPTISDIANRTVNQDTSTGAIPFTVGDVETAAANLSLSGSSSNTTLVPNGNITFGGSGANRTITITPAAGQIGTTTITVTVTDADGGTASDTFVLTVNRRPTISNIADQTTDEDTPTNAIAFTVGDAETPAANLALSAVSSNQTLVPNGNITFGGSGANRTVTVNPALNQFGTTTITVTVTDASNATASASFVVTVNPVNDNPTISGIGDQFTNPNTPITVGFTVDDPETPAGSLTLAGSSSNQILIPDANIVFGGAGANRTIQLTPAANQTGTTIITITVTDADGSTGSRTFLLTVRTSTVLVTNGNDSGAGSLRSAVSTVADGGTVNFAPDVTLVTLTSGEIVLDRSMTINGTGANKLTVSGNNNTRVFHATVPSPAIVTVSGVTVSNGRAGYASGGNCDGGYCGGGILLDGTGVLNILNCALSNNSAADVGGGIANIERGTINISGSAVSGNGSYYGGGIYEYTGRTNITNSTISGNSAANGGGIYGDYGEYGGLVTIVNSTVSRNSASEYGGGVYANNYVTLRNTIVALNTARFVGPDISGYINSLDYNLIKDTSYAYFTGTTAHNIYNQDPKLAPLGNYGGATQTHALLPTSPALDAGSNCVITANGCGDGNAALTNDQRGTNSPRKIGANVDIGAFERNISFDQSSLSDGSTTVPYNRILTAKRLPDGTSVLTFAIISIANQSLPPGLTLASDGAISGTPTQAGTFTFTVKATDSDAMAGASQFSIVINNASSNTPPTISDIADQSTDEDTATNPIAFTVGDAESPAANLTVSATSSNQTLVPNANITLGGAGANRTIRLTPAANQNGTATITVTVSDGSLTAQDTFVLTVNAVNDAPSFTKGANQSVAANSGAQTVPNWATNISKGPPDESGQTLTFNVTNNNNALFSAQPAISPNGTLTYTPASGASGTATVTVTLSDNGSNTPPNVNTSAPQTFTITINAASTNPSGTGAASPNLIQAGNTTLLTVVVTPGTSPASSGITVAADLSGIGGSSVQSFFDNGTNGDATAGDNIFSFNATVAAANSAGSKSLPVTIADGQSRSASTAISLTVTAASNTVTWIGGASGDASNWNNAANWNPATIPTSTSDVVIPASGVSAEPIISDNNISVNSLNESSGRTLTINGGRVLTVTNTCAVNGTMNIAGVFNCGSLMSTGTISFTGTGAQRIPTGTYNNLTVNNAAGFTLGGNVTVNGTLTLTGGIITTGLSNTLTIGANGSISGASASSYVIGNLRKNFSAVNGNLQPALQSLSTIESSAALPAAFLYPVGTTSGLSPVTINAKAGGGNLSFTVSANESFLGGVNTAQSIKRFWTLTPDGITQADITFQYLDADVPAGANESNFNFIRRSNSTNTYLTPTLFDATKNSFTLNDVTQFSDWSLGTAALVPTAATVTVSGRVLTPAGRGLMNAVVILTDTGGNTRATRTTSFGYYRFSDVTAGETYVMGVSSKRFQFVPQVVTVMEDTENLNFSAVR